jgi:hypothetical protein
MIRGANRDARLLNREQLWNEVSAFGEVSKSSLARDFEWRQRGAVTWVYGKAYRRQRPRLFLYSTWAPTRQTQHAHRRIQANPCFTFLPGSRTYVPATIFSKWNEDDVAWAKKGEKGAGKAAKKETGSIGFQQIHEVNLGGTNRCPSTKAWGGIQDGAGAGETARYSTYSSGPGTSVYHAGAGPEDGTHVRHVYTHTYLCVGMWRGCGKRRKRIRMALFIFSL